MASMNMILIEALKDNMNFNILSRNHILFTYFVLFLLHEVPSRDFDMYDFSSFSFRTCWLQWYSGQASSNSTLNTNGGRINRRGEFVGCVLSSRRKNSWYLFLYPKLILLNKRISTAFHMHANFAAMIPSFSSQSYLAADYSYAIFYVAIF